MGDKVLNVYTSQVSVSLSACSLEIDVNAQTLLQHRAVLPTKMLPTMLPHQACHGLTL